jgi:hypothetical protein
MAEALCHRRSGGNCHRYGVASRVGLWSVTPGRVTVTASLGDGFTPGGSS